MRLTTKLLAAVAICLIAAPTLAFVLARSTYWY